MTGKPFFAFLRAINVGGRTVRMARLRAIFEELGFTNVATLIASGNVIFESEASERERLETRIEKRLKEALGFEVATFVRSRLELVAIARHRPFETASPKERHGTLYVGFLRKGPSQEGRARIRSLQSEVDRLSLHQRELYWHVSGRFKDSALSGAVLEKALAMPLTLRNVNTVHRLVEKFAG